MGLFVSSLSAQQFEEIGPTALPGVTTLSGSPEVNWILEVNGGGVVLGDFDGEGNLDLVVIDGSTPERVQASKPGSPPRLFLGKGDATFAPAGKEWGMLGARWGMGGVAGDLDGDGSLDLFVTEWGPDRVFLGGDGLKETTSKSGLQGSNWGTSAALLDFDLDGVLDVAVINYLEFDFAEIASRTSGECTWKGRPVNCGPEGLSAQHDQLYRGLGDGTFELCAGQAFGFRPNTAAFGLGVVTGDFDADGDTDLYVTNDSTPNHLWDNREGDAERGRHFENIAMRLGVAVDANGREQAGMGVGCGDLDGDSRADFFVTNFSGENHSLYLSANRRSYRERSHGAGVAGPSRQLLGWGAGLADLDNDADLDLFAFHGHVYPESDREGTDTSYAQPDYWMQNISEDGKVEFAPQILSAGVPTVSRAAAFGDLDRDGDLDLVAIDRGGPVRVLRNTLSFGEEGSWIGIRLTDSSSVNRAAIGAKVELSFLPLAGESGSSPTRNLHREVTATGGFQAGLAAEVHFGLGTLGAPTSGRVIWPDGVSQPLSASELNSAGKWIVVTRSEAR
jgi:hypothetical protein